MNNFKRNQNGKRVKQTSKQKERGEYLIDAEMLSRASQLTRLNAAYILRQLSVSPSNLSKQAHLSQKETTAYDESNQPIATLSSSTTTTTTTTTTSGVSSTTDSKDIRSATRSTGSNNRGANNSDQSRENWKPLSK